jgi:ketosteroid isomerase-like protein
MGEDKNLEVTKKFYATFANRGSSDYVKNILDLLSADIEWDIPGPVEVIPFAGLRKGKDQVAEFFKIVGDTAELRDYSPNEFISQGDKVVALGTDKGTIKATGQHYDNKWVHVFDFKDGHISRFRQWYSMDAVMDAVRR